MACHCCRNPFLHFVLLGLFVFFDFADLCEVGEPRTFRWEDGRVIPSSVNYVHQKDEHLHAVVGTVLKTL